MRHDDAEYLAGVLGELTRLGKALAVLMVELRQIVQLEHELISLRDIDQLESLTQDKIENGLAIERHVQGIQQLGETIRNMLPRQDQSHDGPTSGNLSLLLKDIQAVRGGLAVEGLPAQVLDHAIGEFAVVSNELQDQRQEIQPKIEMNSYVTQAILNRHREMMRFWQEVSNESCMTYGASGETKGKSSSSSVLRVKA